MRMLPLLACCSVCFGAAQHAGSAKPAMPCPARPQQAQLLNQCNSLPAFCPADHKMLVVAEADHAAIPLSQRDDLKQQQQEGQQGAEAMQTDQQDGAVPAGGWAAGCASCTAGQPASQPATWGLCCTDSTLPGWSLVRHVPPRTQSSHPRPPHTPPSNRPRAV